MQTVAAIATGPSQGGIGIVRMSGDESKAILDKAFSCAHAIRPRRAEYGFITDENGIIDEAIAIYMPAPRSYTREDVCEIQCHGGRYALLKVLKRLIELGAEPAGPGEFTKRAFLNGRIDLAQSEAVMSVIKAESDAALRSGVRQLRGGLSKRCQEIADSLTSILADIEVECDFPEEVDKETSRESIENGIREAIRRIDRSIDPRSARMITSGAQIALVGSPNTGKSSILNAVTGFERAIVSPTPGTTRDAVSVSVELNGALFHFWDTAGQRETDDGIEAIGVSIARKTQDDADAVIVVLDGARELDKNDKLILARADSRTIIVINKQDLYINNPTVNINEVARAASFSDLSRIVTASAVAPGGVDSLLDAVVSLCADCDPDRDILTLQRHIDLAKEAKLSLETALQSLQNGYPSDLCAVDVQQAAQSILSIRGLEASEQAIDDIFSRFCVGK